MPQPRMTTAYRTAAAKTPLTGDGASEQAIVTGRVGDYSQIYFLSLKGNIIRAEATIDAPIKVGDIVWVQKTTLGYIIQGTA